MWWCFHFVLICSGPSYIIDPTVGRPNCRAKCSGDIAFAKKFWRGDVALVAFLQVLADLSQSHSASFSRIVLPMPWFMTPAVLMFMRRPPGALPDWFWPCTTNKEVLLTLCLTEASSHGSRPFSPFATWRSLRTSTCLTNKPLDWTLNTSLQCTSSYTDYTFHYSILYSLLRQSRQTFSYIPSSHYLFDVNGTPDG